MKLQSIFAALMLAAASLAGQAATVQLATVGTPQAGQSFDVRLRLDDPFSGLAADEQLLSFGFHLGFDSSLLKLASFAPTSGWDDDSAHLGANIFSASIFPALANREQTSVLLATLHFDVLGSGTTTIALTTDAGDFNQGIGYLFADPVAFDVSKTMVLSPVPEPGALVLMLGGFGGLIAWRRRRA